MIYILVNTDIDNFRNSMFIENVLFRIYISCHNNHNELTLIWRISLLYYLEIDDLYMTLFPSIWWYFSFFHQIVDFLIGPTFHQFDDFLIYHQIDDFSIGPTFHQFDDFFYLSSIWWLLFLELSVYFRFIVKLTKYLFGHHQIDDFWIK